MTNLSTIKTARDFIESTPHHALKTILAKIQVLDEINKKVIKLLNPSLQSACRVANIAENHLILIANNSSIASMVHFMIPDLLKHFQKDPTLKQIKTIQCKVTAQSAVTPGPT